MTRVMSKIDLALASKRWRSIVIQMSFFGKFLLRQSKPTTSMSKIKTINSSKSSWNATVASWCHQNDNGSSYPRTRRKRTWDRCRIVTSFFCIAIFGLLYQKYLSVYMNGLSNNPKLNRIPNIQIIGGEKGGSTSLAAYLWLQMPTCYAFSNLLKEARFFQFYNRPTENDPSYTLRYYQSLFSYCTVRYPTSYIVDATPETLLYPERVYEIYKQQAELTNDPTVLTNLKIILTLRDPVDREISFYYFRAGRVKPAFNIIGRILSYFLEDIFRVMLSDDATKALSLHELIQQTTIPALRNPRTNYDNLNINFRYGVYVEHLKKWFQYFDRKNILILSFDELKYNSTALTRRLHEFLDVPIPQDPKDLEIGHWNKAPRKDGTTTTKSTTKAVRGTTTTTSLDTTSSSKQTCETFYELQRLYVKHNEDLYELLEQNPGPSMEQRPFPKFNYSIKNC